MWSLAEDILGHGLAGWLAVGMIVLGLLWRLSWLLRR